MIKKIPFFDYTHVFGQYKNEIQKIILDISNRGSFILQSEGLDFEKNLAFISNQVKYKNLNTSLQADKVEIDLISKNLKIFMNDNSKTIKIINKE